MAEDLERRCGTCARFVRVVETIDDTGEVKRKGECLLGVWPSPLYETSTCSQWVRRGDFKARPAPVPSHSRGPSPAQPRREHAPHAAGAGGETMTIREPVTLALPEDLLEMDANEFRRVLRYVIRDELGVGEVPMAGKWKGGEVVLKPGAEGLQEKRIPIDALFHKIVMIRDKLRVLEQKINSNPKLADDEKLQMQQYVTGCYGSLTTFNVLFADKDDQFVGQKGDE